MSSHYSHFPDCHIIVASLAVCLNQHPNEVLALWLVGVILKCLLICPFPRLPRLPLGFLATLWSSPRSRFCGLRLSAVLSHAALVSWVLIELEASWESISVFRRLLYGWWCVLPQRLGVSCGVSSCEWSACDPRYPLSSAKWWCLNPVSFLLLFFSGWRLYRRTPHPSSDPPEHSSWAKFQTNACFFPIVYELAKCVGSLALSQYLGDLKLFVTINSRCVLHHRSYSCSKDPIFDGQESASACGAPASHRSGFSCCGAWDLRSPASVVVASGLSCLPERGIWDFNSLTRDPTYVPCFGKQILKPLNHPGSPPKLFF